MRDASPGVRAGVALLCVAFAVVCGATGAAGEIPPAAAVVGAAVGLVAGLFAVFAGGYTVDRPVPTHTSGGQMREATSMAPGQPTLPTPATPSAVIRDSVAADAKLVSKGTVTAVDFDENSRNAPINGAFYTTVRHGRMDFRLAVVRLRPSDYRIYILDQPSYGSRNTGAHPTHRLTDPRGRHFVCWTEPIPTARAAMAIGGEWAELTVRYILTGVPIEHPDPTRDRHEELVRTQLRSPQ